MVYVVGAKEVSRSYVVKHHVPQGMQCLPCSKPPRGAVQTEHGYSAENNDLYQLC